MRRTHLLLRERIFLVYNAGGAEAERPLSGARMQILSESQRAHNYAGN
jgi:hypothetical protein